MPRKIIKPTDKERDQVRTMAGLAMTEDKIALVMGVAPKTLRKYYRQELDTAHAHLTVNVGRSLYKNAVENNNVSAQIFWMKCRGGWREQDPQTVKVEHSGAIGMYDLKKVSDADLKRLKQILRSARRNPDVDGGGSRSGDASA